MKILDLLIKSCAAFSAVACMAGCGESNSSSSATPSYLSYVDEGGDTVRVEYKSGSFTDSRDGHKYKTVTVGDYTWMAENLVYGGVNDTNESKYGTRYSYSAALDACPAGWHLPSFSDWNALFNILKAVYGDSVGWALKSSSGWNGDGEGTSGNGGDVIGFSARAGGLSNGYYGGEGEYAAFWVNAAKDEDGYASAIRFDYDDEGWNLPNLYAGRAALYVRCINNANTMLGTLGTCNESKEDSVAVYKDYYFTCKDSNWVSSSKNEILNFEFGACEKALFNSQKVLNDTSYICDGRDSGWRVSTMTEALGECSLENKGKLKSYLKTKYICDEGSWDYQWREATANDILPECTSDKNTDFEEYNDTAYICMDGSWQRPSDVETALGTCSESYRGKVKNAGDTQYVCINRFWRPLNIVEKQLGSCTQDGATGVFDGITFTCDAKRSLWRGILNGKYGVVAVDSLLWLTDDVFNGQWSVSPFSHGTSSTVCPAGWKITSDTTWKSLFEYARKYGGWQELAHVDSDSSLNFYGLNLLQKESNVYYWLSSATTLNSCDYDDNCSAPAASIGPSSSSISSCWACNSYASAGVCTSTAAIRCVKSVE
ncbi:MAG: hypothetical protein M0P13_03520 [Fibrobacteraceae bacterium]|nr:hypothetical protein [Fibrobacteraceae bacterium]